WNLPTALEVRSNRSTVGLYDAADQAYTSGTRFRRRGHGLRHYWKYTYDDQRTRRLCRIMYRRSVWRSRPSLSSTRFAVTRYCHFAKDVHEIHGTTIARHVCRLLKAFEDLNSLEEAVST
ncbi:unnamed protein product, partial [Ectocarpus fasciculatus]